MLTSTTAPLFIIISNIFYQCVSLSLIYIIIFQPFLILIKILFIINYGFKHFYHILTKLQSYIFSTNINLCHFCSQSSDKYDGQNHDFLILLKNYENIIHRRFVLIEKFHYALSYYHYDIEYYQKSQSSTICYYWNQ